MNWNNTSVEWNPEISPITNPIANFCINKAADWGYKTNNNYQTYIRQKGRASLTQELKNDPVFRDFVMPFILTYADNLKEDTVRSLIQGVLDPEQDVLDILVGAFLDAVGCRKEGNWMIGVGVVALIVAGFFLFGSKK